MEVVKLDAESLAALEVVEEGRIGLGRFCGIGLSEVD